MSNLIPTPVTDAIDTETNDDWAEKLERLHESSKRFEQEAWTFKELNNLNRERIIEQNAQLEKYKNIIQKMKDVCKNA